MIAHDHIYVNVLTERCTSEARVDVSPPAYLRWMLWGAVAFLALLVLAAHRAMQTKPAATPPGA